MLRATHAGDRPDFAPVPSRCCLKIFESCLVQKPVPGQPSGEEGLWPAPCALRRARCQGSPTRAMRVSASSCVNGAGCWKQSRGAVISKKTGAEQARYAIACGPKATSENSNQGPDRRGPGLSDHHPIPRAKPGDLPALGAAGVARQRNRVVDLGDADRRGGNFKSLRSGTGRRLSWSRPKEPGRPARRRS